MLRELAVPLFRHSSEPPSLTAPPRKTTGTTEPQPQTQSVRRDREVVVDAASPAGDSNSNTSNGSDARHCYYMYYERKSDGHMLQQIFCRGTTLFDDIVTDLKALYVYDEELECYLHMVRLL